MLFNKCSTNYIYVTNSDGDGGDDLLTCQLVTPTNIVECIKIFSLPNPLPQDQDFKQEKRAYMHIPPTPTPTLTHMAPLLGSHFFFHSS